MVIDQARINQKNENDTLVEILNKSAYNSGKSTEQLNIEKEKLLEAHTQIIKSITSFEQLQAFKNITASLEPTLKVLAHRENQELHLSTVKNFPPNKKIIPQKRFYSTKKSCKKRKKNALSTPEPNEADIIANKLLIPTSRS